MRLKPTDKVVKLQNGAKAVIDAGGRMLAYSKNGCGNLKDNTTWDFIKKGIDKR